MFFIVLFCFCFGFVLNVDGVVFDHQDFYSKYTRLEWGAASEKQKKSILNDYVKRESCALDAKKNGFNWDPFVVEKFNLVKNRLLVNFAYEEFVAKPLVGGDVLDLGLENLKKEVFIKHILVSYNTSALSASASQTKEEAFVLSSLLSDSLKKDLTLFDSFVGSYSNDPSASKNTGVLGWVQWGRAPMPFQAAAWSLLPGEVSDPVLTDYGYHVLVIEETRPSEFSLYDKSTYKHTVLATSIPFIKENLRDASSFYDNKELNRAGVFFHKAGLGSFLNLYVEHKKSLDVLGKKHVDFSSFALSLDERFLICSFFGNDYGLGWFVSKIKDLPPSKIPVFKTVDNLVSFFKTFVLREIAIKKALEFKLDEELFFIKRWEVEKNKILYDVYLKFLVNSVSVDSSSVKQYFLMNRDKKYMDPEKVVVRQIRLKERFLADSLFFVIEKNPGLFESLAGRFSLNRKNVFGLMEPFEKGKYNQMGQVAFELSVGEVFGPIENLDKTFSIIRLEKKIDKKHLDIKRVYKRIESLLLKESQENIKTVTFDKYIKNKGVSFGEEFKLFFN